MFRLTVEPGLNATDPYGLWTLNAPLAVTVMVQVTPPEDAVNVLVPDGLQLPFIVAI
jgi:hypothetical protein